MHQSLYTQKFQQPRKTIGNMGATWTICRPPEQTLYLKSLSLQTTVVCNLPHLHQKSITFLLSCWMFMLFTFSSIKPPNLLLLSTLKPPPKRLSGGSPIRQPTKSLLLAKKPRNICKENKSRKASIPSCNKTKGLPWQKSQRGPHCNRFCMTFFFRILFNSSKTWKTQQLREVSRKKQANPNMSVWNIHGFQFPKTKHSHSYVDLMWNFPYFWDPTGNEKEISYRSI